MSYRIAFSWGRAPHWVKNQMARPRPIKSAAGWYVGTTDETGSPEARWSEEYYPTQYACNMAIMYDNWTRREAP